MNLRDITSKMRSSPDFGDFTEKLVGTGEMWAGPRNGNQDDKAHPPIHPVKLARQEQLNLQEWKVYDLLIRQFLGSMAKDAVGSETSIQVEMGGEEFSLSGLVVEQRNFLEIYSFDQWTDKFVPIFEENEQFKPSLLDIHEGQTQPPSHLTESDLITLMDKHGIGTDATIHEHIKTVQERGYAVKSGIHIVPKQLGVSLVQTYQKIGIDLYKPYLRAQMERDMKDITLGVKNREQALKESVENMLLIYKQTASQKD
mmetsp:Transcript_10587/g.17777  ORF Transcript_10587/g.17777 Transcript_10587/m.17777 type:complete len:256 (+) Transcript_10587:355-1122(+)